MPERWCKLAAEWMQKQKEKLGLFILDIHIIQWLPSSTDF